MSAQQGSQTSSLDRPAIDHGSPRVGRRALLGWLPALLLGPWSSRHAAGQERPRDRRAAGGRRWSLDDFASNVQSGGPPKDGIPPIDSPRYVAAAEAEKFMRPDDIVFGFGHAGVVKAYPQKVLVWHEIVNDDFRGEKLSITYCPLTGSAVAFRGRSRTGGAPLTFGTTGKLVNSNLLMYDRQTDSHWPQILAQAIRGATKGEVLEEISLDWTTWGRWRRRYPETLVLSTETGFLRTYGSDPYGSYGRRGTYYDSGEPFFPVMASDGRFPSKHVVIGVKLGGRALAVPKAAVATRRVINGVMGETPLVALYDADFEVARLFERRTAAGVLSFREDGSGFVDDATGSRWAATGRCERGPLQGAELRAVPAYDVMWFAWYAFFPDTDVWGETRR